MSYVEGSDLATLFTSEAACRWRGRFMLRGVVSGLVPPTMPGSSTAI